MNEHCPPECPIDGGKFQVFDYRLSSVENAVKQIADAVTSIADTTRQLAVLEQRHSETREALNRAFEEIRGIRTHHVMLSERTAIIEKDIPGILETRGDVRKIAWLLITAVVVALLGAVIGVAK